MLVVIHKRGSVSRKWITAYSVGFQPNSYLRVNLRQYGVLGNQNLIFIKNAHRWCCFLSDNVLLFYRQYYDSVFSHLISSHCIELSLQYYNISLCLVQKVSQARKNLIKSHKLCSQVRKSCWAHFEKILRAHRFLPLT